MPAPLTFSGPAPHDELASWSTARLGPEPVGEVLAMGALPWPGHRVHPGGRTDLPGVFVRTTPATSDDAAAVCYVHGLAGSSANWTSLAGLLAPLATGYALDQPGSGRSDPPADGDYSVRSHVETLAAVLRDLTDSPVHLVGNSLGGVLSTHLAAAHPELFSSLTLISPAVPDFRMTRDRGADVRLAALLAPGVGAWAEPRLAQVSAEDRVEGLAQLCFGDASVISPEDRAAALGEIVWRKDLPWTQHAVVSELRGLMASYLSRGRRSFWGAAAQIQVPTLIVWGTRDKLVDVRLARRTAAAFADSRLLVLPGVGHVAQMEAPVPTARAIAALWADVSAGASDASSHPAVVI